MRQIIALGGGGFSTEQDNLALEHYILAQTGKKTPKVCFLPTASADSQVYIDRFYAAFGKMDAEPSHQPLFQSPPRDIPQFLLSQDVIYVGGGNTKNMLAIWRAWGIDEVLRTAWERGIVLCGISAGALCWFDAGVTDSIPGTYTPLRALGFLQGSFSPHYDTEPERRPALHKMIFDGALGAGIAADDNVAVHYVERQLSRIVRTHDGPTAYRVEMEHGEIIERRLRAETL